MVTWGIIAAALAAAPNTGTVYALRFLLGLAEAGFFPSILVYLTHWIPNRERTRVVSTFMISIPLSSVVGGPLNGWVLTALDGVGGLDGWRWVFLIGGLAAVLLGVVFFFAATDRPADATWLTREQRGWLTSTLAAEEAERAATAPAGHGAALRDRRVLALAAVYFLLMCGAYPLTYWTPSVIKDLGGTLSTVDVGRLSAVPFFFAAICRYVAGRRADSERGAATPVLVALGVSLVMFVATAVSLGIPMLAFAAIIVATMAAQTAKPLFWSLPTAFLAGAGAASGIALINSLGNAAGFISPYAVGWIQDASGGDLGLAMGVMILADALAMAVIAGLWWSGRRTRRATPAAEAPARSTTDR